jgi:hypothetical protein
VGIWVDPGKSNVIARNRVSDLRQSGNVEGAAIQVDGGDLNVIARNSVLRSEGDGIGLGGSTLALSNVVRGNAVRGAGEDRFHVMTKAKDTQLRRNLARHSGDDGFDVESRTTRLIGNRAVRNADLGIEAVRGVTDRGGNRARRNGDPRQCTNVECG